MSERPLPGWPRGLREELAAELRSAWSDAWRLWWRWVIRPALVAIAVLAVAQIVWMVL